MTKVGNIDAQFDFFFKKRRLKILLIYYYLLICNTAYRVEYKVTPTLFYFLTEIRSCKFAILISFFNLVVMVPV